MHTIKELNPGIAKLVHHLIAAGFRTTDSGDGETHLYGCDPGFPYIHIIVEPESLVTESKRLKTILFFLGVEIEPLNEDGSSKHIQASFDPAGDFASMSVLNVKDSDCQFPAQ